LAGALLFEEKFHPSTALFWFGLRDVGILYWRAVIQRTIDVSPAFLEHGSAEKIAVWVHANYDPIPNKREVGSFLHEAAAQLAGRYGDKWIEIVYGEEKIYFVLWRLEQPRQDKNLWYLHEEHNEPTK
jgi:hypothetical protein